MSWRPIRGDMLEHLMPIVVSNAVLHPSMQLALLHVSHIEASEGRASTRCAARTANTRTPAAAGEAAPEAGTWGFQKLGAKVFVHAAGVEGAQVSGPFSNGRKGPLC